MCGLRYRRYASYSISVGDGGIVWLLVVLLTYIECMCVYEELFTLFVLMMVLGSLVEFERK